MSMFTYGNFQDLERISLSSVRAVDDHVVIALVTRCPSLTSLVLNYTNAGDASLEAIFCSSPNLQELAMQCCTGLSSEGIKRSFSSSTGPAGRLFITLSSTAGDACTSEPDEQHERNHGSYVESKAFHSLTSLSLASCTTLTDAALSSIGQCCSKLKRLRLDGCKRISDPGILSICTNCPSMKKLSLSSCPKLSRYVLDHLSTLRHLEVLRINLTKKLDCESVQKFVIAKPEVAVFVQAADEGQS
jgi:hypothetical protein